MNNDLISREALKEAISELSNDNPSYYYTGYLLDREKVLDEIDNAPTVEPEITEKQAILLLINNGWLVNHDKELREKWKRPQGEREFIEIIARYEPDDICTYPEYRGKPYYSIHYQENGEEFVGYGTYSIEVLSRYLKDYFFSNCGADMKGGAE